MQLDDPVCYCFRISRRKIANYIRINQPRVVSQLSQCGGAGTGCGWCIPYLRHLFQRADHELEALNAEEYAQRRAMYIAQGGGCPPPGALPLPQVPAETQGSTTKELPTASDSTAAASDCPESATAPANSEDGCHPPGESYNPPQ
ncbi:(2Fe-2S)-binding protein [Tuwongella immobilis]|uniref:BFD-like [2Fe-2S]-binding domain-containing protein n=1 Tax=Tuwongella immobilis TaxID=692036 RepID=A0A6C2YIG2_9BACT|nr:(2Fe-2S)-binding protein [Tuwongella immobilis]VIP00865.1 bfd domain protein (2fe-2s)-binding domain protein : BFD domain protein (2Fe-2S)-binding domain protein OS=Planctomyces limnophilus (strain ATCC 43296 / DSM 3776 / IFAM 1008 / 290) GN=Plim_1171 PE=4 SV=1: Fer2_BFD [Tuwongella immobilis]VTR97148.1 bfd domain protein (2fe-2s)-binding domain protein : BFD domain protein (2Fe-2S)-binding domain protein OS=Planctomyces limnophilus (strain ATCC 43296 / DSM 3776 / IFAM 1008 / 290) GN=Plim_1171